MGEHDITTNDDNAKNFKIWRVKIHPDYEGQGQPAPYDYALLRLEKQLHFGPTVSFDSFIQIGIADM